jgi:hypothetical protein
VISPGLILLMSTSVVARDLTSAVGFMLLISGHEAPQTPTPATTAVAAPRKSRRSGLVGSSEVIETVSFAGHRPQAANVERGEV